VTAMTEFAAPADDLGKLKISTAPSGILLGNDHLGRPVRLRLFRQKATRIVLVDRWWVERILVFRSLALGARIVIHTPTPQQWQGFGERATGEQQRLITAPQDQPVAVPASVRQPGLVVTEGPPLELPFAGPWHAQLTVAPWFGDYLGQPILDADLVILRRLSARELAIATSMLRIDQQDAAALKTTPDDGVVLYQPGMRRYVRLAPTPLEQQAFGAPRTE
jgi:hypothetical protein